MQELICSCADVIPVSANEDNGEGDTVYDNSSSDRSRKVHPNNNNNRTRYELPNPSAVLKTVTALIAINSINPHQKIMKNLKNQQEFQVTTQELKRNSPISQNLVLEQNGTLLEQEDDNIDEDENFTQKLITEEQNKLTATFAKEQMMMEFNNQNYDEFDNYDNNSNNGVGDGISCHYEYYTNGQTKTRYSKSGPNNDNSNKNDKQYLYDSSSTTSLNVDNFHRQCNLKTFQKIKLNLMTHHGNSSGNYCSSSTSKDSSTLQTIEETDNDVITSNSSSTINAGLYKIVDEKNKINENELSLKVPCDQSSNDIASIKLDTSSNMKYKLLNLSSLKKSSEKSNLILPPSSECLDDSAALPTSGSVLLSTVSNTVSKRIEFFEHANIPNGGIIKPKSNIYSIYRVNDNMVTEDVNLKKQLKAAGPSKTTSTNSFLLRHDSQTLTIILSCVFIVTFLLLVFFPLPG